MKAIGGYFELELPFGNEFYRDAMKERDELVKVVVK